MESIGGLKYSLFRDDVRDEWGSLFPRGNEEKKFLQCVSGPGPGWRKKFISRHNDVDDAKPYDVGYNDDVADADDVDKYDDDAGMPTVG